MTVTFNLNQLPPSCSAEVSGNDLVVRIEKKDRFPHITFHAKTASNNKGACKLTYDGVVRYHVAVRDGVYVGRKYEEGWKNDASDTTAGFDTDKKLGESIALDIEQVLKVV